MIIPQALHLPMLMSHLSRRLTILFCLSFLTCQLTFSQESRSPNFVFILLDDFGWTFPSFPMDEKYPNAKSDYFETPNLQKLAEMGMRFSNAYSPASICSPTRRSIQFGQTPARQGEVYFKANHDPIKSNILAIPNMLKVIDGAYRTAHYGKWDIRTDIFPEDIGYDESDGNTRNGNGNMFREKSEKWTEAFLNGDPKKIESLTSRGLNFMERQAKAGHPFYLQISHYATHVDMQTKPETYAKYEKKKKGEMHNLPQFAGMVADVDDAIGRIMEKVESLGIEENTYIFLMTDNGGVPFIAPNKDKLLHPSEYRKPGRNTPLRGGKWTLYEGGIRVPFFAAGPGVEKNSQCDAPIAGWDMLPTLASLAGFEGELPTELDGGSMEDVLRNGNEGEIERPSEGLVFHRFSGGYPHSAIRVGKYKLVKFWKEDKLELYDLDQDLGEMNDLATQMPEKVEELHEKLMRYLLEVDAEILKEYPNSQYIPFTKGKLLYKNDFSQANAFKNWVMEGPGKTEVKDGWMHMYAPNEEEHHVYWCPEDFPESYIAEWELQNLETDAGLCIVFFSTKGINGEDIFDPNLKKRDGIFRKYTKSDLNCYHISYYANAAHNPNREVSHLRKNAGFYKVQVGKPGIPAHSTDINKVRLVKDKNKISMYVGDRRIIHWIDDGTTYGSALEGGKIGFRQMKWSHFRYRNFKVWALK